MEGDSNNFRGRPGSLAVMEGVEGVDGRWDGRTQEHMGGPNYANGDLTVRDRCAPVRFG